MYWSVRGGGRRCEVVVECACEVRGRRAGGDGVCCYLIRVDFSSRSCNKARRRRPREGPTQINFPSPFSLSLTPSCVSPIHTRLPLDVNTPSTPHSPSVLPVPFLPLSSPTLFVLYIRACGNAIDAWRHSCGCTHYCNSLVRSARGGGGQTDFPAIVCIGSGSSPFVSLSYLLLSLCLCLAAHLYLLLCFCLSLLCCVLPPLPVLPLLLFVSHGQGAPPQTRTNPGTPDGTLSPKSFGFILRINPVKKPIESIWKGEARLGRRLDEPPVYDIQNSPFGLASACLAR